MQAEFTNYWDQAYHSSRFCDYFLPEYWNNPFSKEGKDDKYLFNIETAELNNIYIPLVEVYSEKSEDGTTTDQFPVYTIKYDETQTTLSALLDKPIFGDLFSSDSKIFKEEAQRNHIKINENQKLYKNYYTVKSGGKKWDELVRFWLNNPEAQTWFTTEVGENNYDNRFKEDNK